MLENKWKWFKTGAVLLATFNAGFNLGLFGPTLPDVQLLTSSTTAEISTTMIWMGFCSMVGAVFLGSLFDRYDGILVISGCLLCQAFAFSTATLPSILPGFQILISIGFLFNIGLLTGTMSVSSEIWREVGGMGAPILQATDLVHSLGTALTPIAMANYLNKNQSLFNDSLQVKEDDDHLEHVFFSKYKPVQRAYLITGVFDVVIAIVCFLVFLCDKIWIAYLAAQESKFRYSRIRYYSTSNSKEEATPAVTRARKTSDILFCKKSHGDYMSERKRRRNERDLEGGVISETEVVITKNVNFKGVKSTVRDSFKKELNERRESLKVEQLNEIKALTEKKFSTSKNAPRLSITDLGEDIPQMEAAWPLVSFALVVLLLFVTNGGRDAMMLGLLYTYVHNYLGWGTLQGAGLVTTYHFARTFIHFIFVYLAHRISSIYISIFNIVIYMFSSILMLATSHLSSLPLVFVGIVLTAVASSNTHPTFIVFVQQNLQVTGGVMGVLYGAISAGQIIYSPLLGVSLQKIGAIAFPSFLFITSILTFLFFFWSYYLTRNIKQFVIDKKLKKLESKRRRNERIFNEHTPLNLKFV